MTYKEFKKATKKLPFEVSYNKDQVKTFTNKERKKLINDLTKYLNNTFNQFIEFDAEYIEESDKKLSIEDENKLELADVKPLSETDEILAERGSNYGKFTNHASLSQALKATFDKHVRKHGQPKLFTNTINEAIEMIFHKLARIGNGDPTYRDNYVDIIGYTQLVIDELDGIKR